MSFSSTDDNLIYLVYKKEKLKLEPKIIEYRCFRKLNHEEFIKELEKVDWNFMKSEVFGDKTPEVFEKLVIGILDKFIPTKKKIVKGTNAPWITSSILSLCKERDEHQKNMQFDSTRIVKYKKLRNKINLEISNARRKYYNAKFSKVKSSVDVWNVMNEVIDFRSKPKSKISMLVCDKGEKRITECLAKEFIVNIAISDVVNCERDLEQYENLYAENKEEGQIVDYEVHAEEVQSTICKIKKGLESENNIPKRVYKLFSETLSIPVCIIFTKIFLLAQVPNSFKIASVMPL